MKRVWLEAGGKSANIVFADCPDLDKAVSATAGGIFTTRGRSVSPVPACCSKSIADDFLAKLKAQARHWQPGNPLDPDTTMGMLIDAAPPIPSTVYSRSRARCCWTGGKIRGLPRSARPFSSTSTRLPLSREEIFGPVLVVTRFKTEEEALTLANDSEYGLGAAVWTRDLSRAHRMSRRLKAGSVFVNNYNDGDMTVPFGGYKQSGNGRDKSLHALEKFTELKTIWIALEPQS
jgi:gamma-glutamyl-gamma-aminobutyraldehyde dehydrogenase